MNFRWNSFLIGVISLIGIPLTTFASTSPEGKAIFAGNGIVATVHVGLKDAGWGFYITLLDSNGNEGPAKMLIPPMLTGSYFPSLLSTLMFSKASGNYVTLYNHTDTDVNHFDEVVIEKQ